MSSSGRRGRRTMRQSMSFAVAGFLGASVLAAGAASGAPSGDLSVPSVSNAVKANVGARARPTISSEASPGGRRAPLLRPVLECSA